VSSSTTPTPNAGLEIATGDDEPDIGGWKGYGGDEDEAIEGDNRDASSGLEDEDDNRDEDLLDLDNPALRPAALDPPRLFASPRADGESAYEPDGDPLAEDPLDEAEKLIGNLPDEAIADCLAIYLWALTSHVTEDAYEKLLRIIRRPGFSVANLPGTLKTLKKLHRLLPLAEPVETEVPLTVKMLKTGRQSKSVGTAFSLDLRSLIERTCNNKRLTAFMHFGLGCSPRIKSEVWHGRAWHESIAMCCPAYPIYAPDNSCERSLLSSGRRDRSHKHSAFVHPGVFVRARVGSTGRSGVFRVVGLYERSDDNATIWLATQRTVEPKKVIWHDDCKLDHTSALHDRRLFLVVERQEIEIQLVDVQEVIDALVWREERCAQLRDLQDGQRLVDVRLLACVCSAAILKTHRSFL
jgi:hypothetical protein